jgi:hypothetical protein
MYSSEVSRAIPTRPPDKGRLEAKYSLGKWRRLEKWWWNGGVYETGKKMDTWGGAHFERAAL